MNTHAIELYSEYSDSNYTVTAGNEVSACENLELATKINPNGKCAKYLYTGIWLQQ